MANNRLYILDTETDENFLLAKSLGDGWYVHHADLADRLNAWLEGRDYDGQAQTGATGLMLLTEHEMDVWGLNNGHEKT